MSVDGIDSSAPERGSSVQVGFGSSADAGTPGQRAARAVRLARGAAVLILAVIAAMPESATAPGWVVLIAVPLFVLIFASPWRWRTSEPPMPHPLATQSRRAPECRPGSRGAGETRPSSQQLSSHDQRDVIG